MFRVRSIASVLAAAVTGLAFACSAPPPDDGTAPRFESVQPDLFAATGALTNAWADFDGDGDPDLVVDFAPGDGPVLKLYADDGGRFTDVARERGIVADRGVVRQIAGIDVDGDEDLDIFVAFRDRANALFRNDGGRFTDAAAELGLAWGGRAPDDPDNGTAPAAGTARTTSAGDAIRRPAPPP